MSRFDIVIVGAGMAGASLGAQLAPHASVLMIEMEDAPAYHATGRSVAFWTESYGGAAVQPLTTASGSLLACPDPAFSDRPFLSRRGAIHIGRTADAEIACRLKREFEQAGVALHAQGRTDIAALLPGLRPEWVVGLSEPSTADIDVAALHAAYLRAFAHAGGQLRTGTALGAARRASGGWVIETVQGAIRCDTIVNAAGAWADAVARACGVAPIGITPLRRTVVQLRTAPGAADALPLVLDLRERFYFKPAGAGRLWLSPHDETPDVPGDAAADELAVAVAIDRFQSVVDWRIEAVERKWAGLRSFAPDRLPVYGFDGGTAGFFWFAGQGGFGIQTAPAAALLAAALLTGGVPDGAVAHIDPGPYRAQRFYKSG